MEDTVDEVVQLQHDSGMRSHTGLRGRTAVGICSLCCQKPKPTIKFCCYFA